MFSISVGAEWWRKTLASLLFKVGFISTSGAVSCRRRRRTLQGHYFFGERQTMSPEQGDDGAVS
jgi:hypothetical protein